MFQPVIIDIALLCVIISVIIAARSYFSVKHTMAQLERMLDRAIAGDFSVEQMDESILSALEFKLARYLDTSTVSAKNVAIEKERIQMLVSDISHQTKTPISSLRLYGELLEEQELPEEVRSYVNTINIQTKKLDFLISALVKMSRLETGVLSLYHGKAHSL